MDKMLESLATMYNNMSQEYRINLNSYKKALVLIGDILSFMEEDTSMEYKIYFVEVATRILDMPIDEKDQEFCQELARDIAAITYEVKTFDDIVKKLMFPKVSPTEVIDNIFYTSAAEMSNDFRKYVGDKRKIPARKRDKAYSYMTFIAQEMLAEIRKSGLTPDNYDEYILLWIFEQIEKSEEFDKVYDELDSRANLYFHRKRALYLKLVHNA